MPRDSFRPSDRQIWNHIVQGIKALKAGGDHARIIADKHNQEAMDFLGVTSMNDVISWVLVFLEEILERGPKDCFINHGWVDRCYEPGFEGLPLFPYLFQSQHFHQKIYLKFGIKKIDDEENPFFYCHLDLHSSNPD